MAWLDTELQRLLDPGYLDGVKDRSLEEVRAMRAECQEAETAVSFLRRIAQGRLDLVHACLDRSEDTPVDLDAIVEHLPAIIGSGPPRPAGFGRLPSQMSPDMEHEGLTEEIDAVIDADRIAALPDLGRDELQAMADQLSTIEARISEERRALHERIDKLQAEIVSRYKSGEASIDGLLA